MKCEYCEIVDRNSNSDIIYEDDDVVAVVKDLAATPDQITVFPKEHYTILELVPDDIVKKCADLANKVSISIFENLGAQGTNIVINNGLGAEQKVPHFAIEIFPRTEADTLNLQWEPKQLAEDEMETAFALLKAEGSKLKDIGKVEQKLGKDDKETLQSGDTEVVVEEESKDNYLLKSLRKIP